MSGSSVFYGDTTFGTNVTGQIHDWTEGTNVFPASDSIVIADPSLRGMTRQWLFIQNQGIDIQWVRFTTKKIDGSAAGVTYITLNSSGVLGGGGGVFELRLGRDGFTIGGEIGVECNTSGDQVVVMEKLI